MSKSNSSGAQHKIEKCQIELQNETNSFNLPKKSKKIADVNPNKKLQIRAFC